MRGSKVMRVYLCGYYDNYMAIVIIIIIVVNACVCALFFLVMDSLLLRTTPGEQETCTCFFKISFYFLNLLTWVHAAGALLRISY